MADTHRDQADDSAAADQVGSQRPDALARDGRRLRRATGLSTPTISTFRYAAQVVLLVRTAVVAQGLLAGLPTPIWSAPWFEEIRHLFSDSRSFADGRIRAAAQPSLIFRSSLLREHDFAATNLEAHGPRSGRSGLISSPRLPFSRIRRRRHTLLGRTSSPNTASRHRLVRRRTFLLQGASDDLRDHYCWVLRA